MSEKLTFIKATVVLERKVTVFAPGTFNTRDAKPMETLFIYRLYSRVWNTSAYLHHLLKPVPRRVLECAVADFLTKLTRYWNDGRGCLYRVTPLRSRSAVASIRDETINVRGPRLFRLLLANIRNFSVWPVDVFKRELDWFLHSVPNQTIYGSYAGVGLQQQPGSNIRSSLEKLKDRPSCKDRDEPWNYI